MSEQNPNHENLDQNVAHEKVFIQNDSILRKKTMKKSLIHRIIQVKKRLSKTKSTLILSKHVLPS